MSEDRATPKWTADKLLEERVYSDFFEETKKDIVAMLTWTNGNSMSPPHRISFPTCVDLTNYHCQVKVISTDRNKEGKRYLINPEYVVLNLSAAGREVEVSRWHLQDQGPDGQLEAKTLKEGDRDDRPFEPLTDALIDNSPEPKIWRAIKTLDFKDVNVSPRLAYTLLGWIVEWKELRESEQNVGEDGEGAPRKATIK